MATGARATVPLLLLAALLFAAAAVASSWDDERTSLGRCLRRCEDDRPSYERSRCVQECREKQQQGREGRREHDRDRRGGEESGDDEREQGRSEGRPYVYGERSFRSRVRSDHGFIKVLEPFHEASKLLRGIRDYRVAILEANPRSFVVPSHADAHCIGYVAQGEGVVATIENGERRSYTIREGDIFVAPAGAIAYLANTDGRRKLVIAKILNTISVPGKFQYFFGPGGRNPESFISSFSKSVQRAAFGVSEERLRRLWGKQDKGVIVRASEEQVRELQRHTSERGHAPHWPLPPFGESRGPYNLFERRPTIANRHGRLYIADAKQFDDLAEHDVRVTLVNITRGSMSTPFYNTRSVRIAVVLEGEGRVEIVCPHLSQGGESERRRRGEEGRSERGKGRKGRGDEDEDEDEKEQEEAGQGYRTIRANLSRGTVFVVPAGHPVVEIASRRSNVQILCFDVFAKRNDVVHLAGSNNVLKKLDSAAKELAFAASAKEVDEVLGAQSEHDFVAGPQESGRGEQEDEDEGRRHRRGEQEEDEGRRHGRGGHGRGDEAVESFLRMAVGGL